MKIAVAMSGGVDSSAAAAILKAEGHDLVGFTMQLWNQRRGISVDEQGDPLPSRCCSLDDVYDARRVAEELGFPFYLLKPRARVRARCSAALHYKLSEWRDTFPVSHATASEVRLAGSTSRESRCDKVATGHYARVESTRTRIVSTVRGRNPQKTSRTSLGMIRSTLSLDVSFGRDVQA